MTNNHDDEFGEEIARQIEDTKLWQAKQIKKQANDENLEAQLERMNHEYAVLARGNQVIILREAYDPVTEERSIAFITRDAFLLLTENKTVTAEKEITKDKGKKNERKEIALVTQNVGRLWLQWKQRRQYDGLCFKPYGYNASRPYVGNSYNLWRGFSFDLPKGGYIGIEKLTFFDHMRVNICRENEEHFQWLLAWLADIFQKPNRKIGTAVILRGARRTGKGVFACVIGALIAKHYITVTHTEQVTGKFNGHLADKILVFLDEALWAGNKEAEGPLKALITEQTMSVEMKGRDVQHIDSYCRILMATNNDWAIPTGLNDENRFAVFDMSNGCRGNAEYFGRIFRELKEEGGYEGLLEFFLNFKYDENILRRAPLTNALLEQKHLSLPRHGRWLYEKLNDGYFYNEGTSSRWPDMMSLDSVYKSYLSYCEDMREKFPLDKTQLTKRIRDFLSIESVSHKRERTWKLPTLEAARIEFGEKLGHELEWDRDGDND